MFQSKNAKSDNWTRLLKWLESHGMKTGPSHLLVTCRNIPRSGRGLVAPSARLFTIPPSALLNVETLQRIYPAWMNPLSNSHEALSATQLISLHLYLYRPASSSTPSIDPTFGPYIDSLPTDFHSHPVSWFETSEPTPSMIILRNNLPIPVKLALDEVRGRFAADWDAVKKALRRLPRQGGHKLGPSKNDYLWAWLNVNTRCVYHSIFPSRSSPHNLTLCPLLDLANHGSHSAASRSNPIPSFISPAEPIKAGDQIFLRYGAHPNCSLFTEYGFIDRAEPGQVKVDDLCEALFVAKGESGKWMRKVLVDEGYWGDWTLHTTPSGHPSYRLLPTLRLLHLELSSYDNDAFDHPDYRRWKATVAGTATLVSQQNEALVKKTLQSLCKDLIARGEAGLTQMIRSNQTIARGIWEDHAIACLSALCKEEKDVGIAVMESVLSENYF